MARLARVVIPGIPYHVTQRGNRRGESFFGDEDRRNDLSELGEAAARFRTPVLGLVPDEQSRASAGGSWRPESADARDPLSGRPLAWGDWLARGLAAEEAEALRQATRTGRPCGGVAFVRELEEKLARPLTPQKRSPKPKEVQDEEIPYLFDEWGWKQWTIW